MSRASDEEVTLGVCGTTRTELHFVKTAISRSLVVFFVVIALAIVGCSQGGVDQVNIAPRHPSSAKVFLTNGELQGASYTSPASASAVMSIHSAGGNSLRTTSQSTTFRMSSGIGVD